MNKQQFIAKQTVKYYWKALRQSATWKTAEFQDSPDDTGDAYWEYEQTPRVTA